MLTRRAFTKLLLGSFGAVALPGCSSSDYTDDDVRQLALQMQQEREQSGHGPYGPLRFRGYRELARLPYFELQPNGLLRLTVEGLPPAIDVHAHLGIALLFAPDLDLQQRTARTRYLLDCDGETPGCDFDLDVYINANFTEAAHTALTREVRNQLLFGSDAAQTHTIPNLLAEMDALGFQQVAVLAIAAGLPFGDHLTQTWHDAIAQAGARDRLLLFASVHPGDSEWRAQLRAAAAQGARGVKLHPEMQRFFPDDPRALEIYAECERLGLPVIFHAGRSGIEPTFMRKYALISRLERGIAEFPRVQFIFGHAGARDVAQARALAKRYPNVWLEITGQGVTTLHGIVDELRGERIVFGSDWPFYPLAATLAKVLLVTERNPSARAAILRTNADQMFAAAQRTRTAAGAAAR